MQDGLYSVNFQTPRGQGAGVVTIGNNKIQGGDSGMFYHGEYSQNGNNVQATIRTGRHANILESVFGIDNVEIILNGVSQGNNATLNGQSPQAPNVPFQVTLTKIAV